jgi:probable addiction module antidote protein
VLAIVDGKETFSHWDAAGYLQSEADMARYLEACLEQAPEDPTLLVAALGDVARALGLKFTPRAA